MSLTEDCVFCRILRGEIPCTKVYEDGKVLAFLDIAPMNPGHTVVIPKIHACSTTDIPVEYLTAMTAAAPKIGVALMRVVKAEGFNLLINNGRVAGQMVPHVHLHVIPRFATDQVVMTSPGVSYAEGEMEDLQRKLQERLQTP